MADAKTQAHVQTVREQLQALLGRKPYLGEVKYACAIGQLEMRMGEAWPGTFNWGAITGTGDAGYVVHKDSKPGTNGETIWYETKFRKYSSDAKGCADFLRVLYLMTVRGVNRKQCLDAAANNDWTGASTIRYDSGYFAGKSTAKTAQQRRTENIAADAKLVSAILKTGRLSTVDWGDLQDKSSGTGTVATVTLLAIAGFIGYRLLVA